MTRHYNILHRMRIDVFHVLAPDLCFMAKWPSINLCHIHGYGNHEVMLSRTNYTPQNWAMKNTICWPVEPNAVKWIFCKKVKGPWSTSLWRHLGYVTEYKQCLVILAKILQVMWMTYLKPKVFFCFIEWAWIIIPLN